MLVGRSRAVSLFTVVVVALAAACGGSDSTGTGSSSPSNMTIVSGNGQVGLVGTALALPLVVKVTGSAGTALRRHRRAVRDSIGSGDGHPRDGVHRRDGPGQDDGDARIVRGERHDLGDGGRLQHLNAVRRHRGHDDADPRLLDERGADASGGWRTARCERHGHLPRRGDRRVGLRPRGLLRQSGPGQILGQVNVTAHGATALTTPDLTPLGDVFADPQRGPSLGGGVNDAQAAVRPASSRESRRFSSRLSFGRSRGNAKRRARSTRFPARGVRPDRLAERERHRPRARNPITIGARVAAVRNTAIVVADTANPAGGFSDAEYRVVRDDVRHADQPARRRELRPADGHRQQRQDRHLLHEGSEQAHADAARRRHDRRLLLRARPVPDDHAERLVGLRRRATSPRCSTCWCRTRRACSATAHGVRRAELTPGTLAHEYQHLINAGRRLYVNTTPTTRRIRLAQRRTEPHRRGAVVLQGVRRSRRGRTSTLNARAQTQRRRRSTTIRATTSAASTSFSPSRRRRRSYGDNDDLETRGATWNLLRYLADHRGTSDGRHVVFSSSTRRTPARRTWRTCSARTT